MDRVEAGADPVEGAEQRVLQTFLLAVGVDDTIHHLLGTGVDPARLVDRAEYEVGVFRIEFGILAHAIDLGRGGEDHPLLVFDRLTDDGQIGFEVELENPQWFLYVGGRSRNCNQRQDHVAFTYVVFDPLLVDGDISLKEVEARVVEKVCDTLRIHVHAIHLPVRGGHDAVGQVMADKAIDAEDEDFFHDVVNSGKSGLHPGAAAAKQDPGFRHPVSGRGF